MAKNVAGKGLDVAKDVAGKGVDVAKDGASRRFNLARDVVSLSNDAMNYVNRQNAKVAKGAFDTVKGITGKAIDVAGGAVSTAGKVASKAGDGAAFVAKQPVNFGNGVVDWGKDVVGGIADVVTDPVGTAKGVGNMVTNPVLNPLVGVPYQMSQGKGLVDAYKDGFSEANQVAGALFDGYNETRKEHGYAGLAGRFAPDLILSLGTGGAEAGVRGGTVAAKAANVAGKISDASIVANVVDEFSEHGQTFGGDSTFSCLA